MELAVKTVSQAIGLDLRVDLGPAAKRIADLMLALVLLLVAVPVLALVALAVRLESKGSPIYRQRRVGRDGQVFEILKLRTMIDGAHALRADLAELNEAKDGLFKISSDPRITRVGRLLRKLHLDELPQLFNVVRGDMSLVGPRPLVEEEDALIPASLRARNDVRPGITGLWQVGEAHDVPLTEMAAIDVRYVTGWNLLADLGILLRTVAHVCAARGK